MSQKEEKHRIGVVAKALSVCNQTVWRMVQSGELQGGMIGNAWYIPQSSIRQYVLRQLGMAGVQATCKNSGEKVSKMDKKSQHVSLMARYYMQKDMGECPAGEFTPHEAIPLLEPFLRKQSWRLGGRDPFLREDMYQSMALAICQCTGTNVLMFYAFRAASRGRDALRKERQRGCVFRSNENVDVVVERPEKPDCSPVIALLKLAGLSLGLLEEEFGIRIFDEGEGNHGGVPVEGRDGRDECDDGRDEDLHQDPGSGSPCPPWAA